MPRVWTVFWTLNAGSVVNTRRHGTISTIISQHIYIIGDDHELDRILGSTSLDEYELVDSPMKEQEPRDSSHEHTGVEMASTSDTGSMLGLTLCEVSSTELHSRVDPFQGSSPSIGCLLIGSRRDGDQYMNIHVHVRQFLFNSGSYFMPDR